MIPLLILIAGLIAWFATSYDTLGIILTIIGGVLVGVQAMFLLIGARIAAAALREQRRIYNELGDKQLRSVRRPR
jgi:uncharacterized membrane-anchored protein